MLLYIRWQKCQIYIFPANLRKYKYIYNIVKETNAKYKIDWGIHLHYM